ncbi:hypothetical protein E1K64_15960 [Salmonella enterica subsp. enterica serovar Poona]|nr:hypothetical protein [Salmonella enterica subsp. enterica serovar Poona]
MAYQTGTAKNTPDLVNQLVTLMKTQGWILNKQENTYDWGSNWYLHHPDVGYLIFQTASDTTLLLYGATGFDGSKKHYEQPGVTQGANPFSGSYGASIVCYDFFVTSRYSHIVIQFSEGYFYHFGTGMLNREGDYTGGQYVYSGAGTSVFPFDHHSEYTGGTTLRALLPGETDVTSGWYNFFQTPPRAMGLGNPPANNGHPDVLAVETSQSALGGVLAPVPQSVYITTSQKLTVRMGVVPDFCVCHMHGLTPRAKVSINGEQWMVIPVSRMTLKRSGALRNGDTFTYAYAFRITA